MAAVSQYFADLAVKEERMNRICKLLELNCTKEFILSIGYTEEEYSEAEIQFQKKKQ